MTYSGECGIGSAVVLWAARSATRWAFPSNAYGAGRELPNCTGRVHRCVLRKQLDGPQLT
jgi:hypothetical protein